MSKRTIAIIGATEKIGSVFSKNLAKANYRLLLFDHNEKKLNALVNEIKTSSPSADIDYMNCVANASWEADIIIPGVAFGNEKELAEKVKPFANRKVIINFSSEDLQKILPGAVVVKVSGFDDLGGTNKEIVIDGNEEEAIQIASEMIKAAGFTAGYFKKNK